MRVGKGSPGNALTLAYMPLGVLFAILLAGLYSFAFHLGFTPPLISLGLLVILVVGIGLATRQLKASAAAGTRLTLAHMGLVCLLGGIAAAPPAEFSPLMLWSITAIAAAAVGILVVEAWITEKVDAAGPFSRRLGWEANGLLVLSLAVLLWRTGKADGWVVAAGAVHYVGLVLSLVLPSLRRESSANWRPYLPIAMAVALILALAPTVPSIIATGLGAVVLVLALAAAATDISAARS